MAKPDLIARQLAERSLLDFIRQGWHVLEPKRAFEENWHHSLICEALEALAAGEIRRLAINISPRSGKSLLASVLFPCWLWTTDPSERFLFASYSAALSVKHSVDRRTLIQSRWYQRFWSGVVKLADDSNLKTEFSSTARGHQIATSVGATATGRGGNYLVCDDLLNPEQANSDAERSTALRWFDETFSTRLDDKKIGRQLIIEQRTHALDLTGHLLAEQGWYHISLPAIAERKTTVIFPRSKREVIREPGDILWPEYEPQQQLDEIRQRLGTFGFQSQYQQSPTAREGNLIRAEWLENTYRLMPPTFDSVILSLDTAFKTTSTADYSAAVVIGHLRRARDGYAPGYYLLDAWRGKFAFGDLKRKAIELDTTWHPRVALVEDAASGQSLIQELHAGTTLPLKPIKPDRDKYTRVAAIVPALEARRLILPEQAWWKPDFIAELTAFPAGAHDDFVDALAQALNYLRDDSQAHRMITFHRLTQARDWIAEGLPVADAAERAGLALEELEDSIARTPVRFIYET